MKPLLIALLLTCGCCFAAASESESRGKSDANGWSRYEILVKRNIFSKDRGRMRDDRSDRKDREKEAPPPPKPETELALIGILQKDGQLVAFVENTKTGAVQALRQGDAIARGKVTAMTLDKMEYTVEGAASDVAIGKTLDGGVISRSAEAASGTAAARPDSGSSDTNSVLERMRKKRQEELRK